MCLWRKEKTVRVLLIDADSKIPNLPLMKLSTYHKSAGDNCELVKANIPYYPGRKKHHFIVPDGYDKYYCSVVFLGNKEYINANGNDVVFGGTGVDLTTELPQDIENLQPDYSLYPKNNISYGFITRGCIRKCKFCFVPKKEGMIKRVNSIVDIVQHKRVKFLDNNILAYSRHSEVLQELILLIEDLQEEYKVIDYDNSTEEEKKYITPNVTVNIDTTGVGFGVGSQLRTRESKRIINNVTINSISFGGAAKDKDRYFNIVTEMYFNLRNLLNQSKAILLLESDTINELCSRKFTIEEAKSRRRIEPKDKFKKRLKKSPDKADSLVLCYYVPKDDWWFV